MKRFHLSPTKLNETQNRDDLRVVWIGSIHAPDELKGFDEYLKEYDSCETCENDIKEVESERKFLLVVKNFIPKTALESLCQIQSIYILQEKDQDLEYNSRNHSKIVGTFNSIDTLVNRLHKDILLTYRGDLPISISPLHEIKNEQSLTKVNGNTLMFVWDQIFIYYLVHPITFTMEELKSDMLKQCELDYKHDKVQLELIKTFGENCSDDNALEWYSKDSFLYRLLNKALRTRNIDFMCKFQYFIIRLYQNFQGLSKSQEKTCSVVYRGQIMKRSELEKLKSNVGCLISINTILSTSCNEEIARLFIHGAEDGVIFKINISNENEKSFRSFADISQFSTIPSEEEVLFFIGTVFSLDSVQHTTDSPCVIELTLNNDPSNHLRKLVSVFAPDGQMNTETYLSNVKTIEPQYTIPGFLNSIVDLFIKRIKMSHRSIMKTDDFNMIEQYYHLLTGKQFSSSNNPTMMVYIHLAFFFSNIGFYDKAIQVYEQILSFQNISPNSPQFIVIHIIIGYLYYHSSQYDEASLHYAIVLSLLSEEDLIIGELYRHIADIKKEKNDVCTTLSYYQEALRIANNRYIPSLRYIYLGVIDILKTQDNLHEAAIYERQLNKTDPDQYYIPISTWGDSTLLYDCRFQLNKEQQPIKRADLLYKIGLHCIVQGHFMEALEHLLQSKDLYITQPPSWDRFPRHLAALFDNIGMLHLFFKDYLKALVMWRKAIDIRTSFPSY
ncbi:unnamed protein product [Adineta steineri]|uniref:NAD(P)(+)--arginine ADP-ribosyltransferase n=1 Tax=Adineta steineri TaxID=433720 RepID=A0A814ZLS6_9BILA|nr:unnamed protein product [Adineta steineri]CAF1531668.1 unnamed protein product [Adineta steineri]